MKEIPLTQGQVALIDDEDYELVSRHKWCAAKTHGGKWYAMRSARVNGRKTTTYMHIDIMGSSEVRSTVDHINGDGLDNRRENLRYATQAEQTRNRRGTRRSSSPYKGVYRYGQSWRASIGANGKTHYLGTYRSAEDAARVYDTKAREFFGEFARCNFG